MTLTNEKLAIYRKYRGDVDMWARAGTKSEKNAMVDADWAELSAILQQLQLVEKGLASAEFAAAAHQKLSDATPDDSLRRAIIDYSASGE
jgi:hypothetical protein